MRKNINVGTKKSSGVVMGIDIGDRFSHYAVIGADGSLLEEGRVATLAETVSNLLSERARLGVVIETGTHSPWVSRLITAKGHEPIVANARKVKLISRSKNKRDRVDALTLARLGLAGRDLLAPVHHRSEQTQQRRAWLLSRDAAVRARTELINHVRGIVKSIGQRLPSCSAEAFPKQAKPSLPCALDAILSPLLAIVANLTKTIRQYDRQIEALSRKHYPVTERLQQVGGVGPITALAYVLTLEDPTRFRQSRTVGAYLGLVPATHQSGEQVPQMHITKEGDVLVRRLLVNAAQYILGHFGPDCDLRRYGLRIAERGGKIAKKRAVVAVARKLAVLLHKLWRDQVNYDPWHVTKLRAAQAA
jgi:transposase